MDSESKGTAPLQDWTLFGLRWLFLLGAGLIIYAVYNETSASTARDIGVAAVIGSAVNLLLGVFIFFPATQKLVPFVVLGGDWLMALLFVPLTRGDANLVLGIVSLLLLPGILRLGALWGTLQAAGVLGITVFSLMNLTGDPIGTVLSTYSVTLLLLLVTAVIVTIWEYMQEQQVESSKKAISEVATRRSAQLSDMQARTRAIYEMASMLSGTLNYQKILDAMLDVGRMSLKETNKRMVSAVLLYREGDNALQVATSRGLHHTDETRALAGNEGVIGEALKTAMPVILNTNAGKDPELQELVGFHGLRSTLIIPLRAGYDNYGVMVFGSEGVNAFTEEHTELLTAISTQATIALQNAVLYQNVLSEKERIVEVEEDARKKLARDLHDGPTQTISAIAMRMSYVYRLFERDPGAVPAELKKVEELARNTTKEIRHLLFGLRPLVLESQGLRAALEQLATKMKETYEQAVAINMRRDVESLLSSQQQGIIFYIVEEAVNNARKHAEAQLISVNIHRRDDNVIIQIADNGVGFDTGAVDANYDKRGSLGMVNMRERTELLNGTLRIDSAEGKGTTISVAIPLHPPREKVEKVDTSGTKLAAVTREQIDGAKA